MHAGLWKLSDVACRTADSTMKLTLPLQQFSYVIITSRTCDNRKRDEAEVMCWSQIKYIYWSGCVRGFLNNDLRAQTIQIATLTVSMQYVRNSPYKFRQDLSIQVMRVGLLSVLPTHTQVFRHVELLRIFWQRKRRRHCLCGNSYYNAVQTINSGVPKTGTTSL
jgi:hypothetical protein